MKKIFLPYILFCSFNSFGQITTLDPVKLNELDISSVTEHLLTDRLSKAVVFSRSQGEDAINRTLLEASIAAVVATPAGMDAITSDLAAGDDNLRVALVNVCAAFNIPTADANGFCQTWARSGPDGSMRAIMSNVVARSDLLARLVPYFLENDTSWTSAVHTLNGLLTNDNPVIDEAIAISLSNATGQTKQVSSDIIRKAKDGDIISRWIISSNIKKIIDSKSALGRALIEVTPQQSVLYEMVWSDLIYRIATDAILSDEYKTRTFNLSPLYEMIGIFTAKAISNGTQPIMNGFKIASDIQNSRYQHIFNNILTERDRELAARARAGSRDSREVENSFNTTLANSVLQNNEWRNLILWHLTRVGEAASMATRKNLGDTMETMDELAPTVTLNQRLPADVLNKLETMGAFSFYPGGQNEYIERSLNNTIEREAYRRFMRVLGNLLESDDFAWDSFVQNFDSNIVQKIVAESIEKSSIATSGWGLTTARNDANIREAFGKFLEQNGSVSSSNYPVWIESLVPVFESGNFIGNAEITRFKDEFSDFVKTPEGWNNISLRLGVEGHLIPQAIRAALIDSSNLNQDEFWVIFQMVSNSNSVFANNIKSNIKNMVLNGSLPDMTLSELQSNNFYVADAVSPIWEEMLEDGSPLLNEITRVTVNGLTQSPLFGFSNLALVETFKNDGLWQLAAPYAAGSLDVSTDDKDLKTSIQNQMVNDAKSITNFYSGVLSVPEIRGEWIKNMKLMPKFLGRYSALASGINSRQDVNNQWRTVLAKKISEDPDMTEAIVRALARRRAGDARWNASLVDLRRSIANILFGDRIFFEQIITASNKDYQNDLIKEVERIFGSFVAQQWSER